jgi:CPA1 family monovalent cation:H+ antiporter
LALGRGRHPIGRDLRAHPLRRRHQVGPPLRAAHASLEIADHVIEADPSEEAEILRLEYRAVLLRAETEPELGIASSELPADPLRRRAIAAAREALLRMRQLEEISDDAFHQVEEELDRAELSAQA